MIPQLSSHIAILLVLALPASTMCLLATAAVIGRPLREATVGRLVGGTMVTTLAIELAALGTWLASGATSQRLSYGAWFTAGENTFAFDFLLDARSLLFATLSTLICGVVAAFSFRYLHREPGYTRYFVLFCAFATGMSMVALAGSIEVLFTGWELLGLSSTLLVGYFHERRAPVVNALRVFAVYRASDAAMLAAAVLVHHWAGSGSLSLLFSAPVGAHALSPTRATVVAVLVIAAVAGKSALLPFSGWLPRAMEGPTPSSAVYYGALSIHAGCFLLLRASPLLDQSLTARVLAGLAGGVTAVYAAMVARTQVDVKSSLAYSALAQVGLIVVEIALGLETLAFIHLVGHACLRLLQFLSAPNVLHDLHELEGRSGTTRKSKTQASPRWRRVHHVALERGFADDLVDFFLVLPARRLADVFDRLDRKTCDVLSRSDRERQ